MSELLRISEIDVFYGDAQVLRGVSLNIDTGSFVSAMGPNGAGKTTLLKTIAGVISPKRGSIEWCNEPVKGGDCRAAVRRGIALVPEGRHIFQSLTVRENLTLGAYLRKDTRAVRADLDAIYEMFPVLANKQNQSAKAMSGGEQQMLAIGRGLMSRPRLLLLDEPSLGLSPLIISQLPAIFRQTRDMFGSAILLVEQNLALAATSERGYLISGGRILHEGPMEYLEAVVGQSGPFIADELVDEEKLASSAGSPTHSDHGQE
jgi:branched-chain amino acid transport system ATP-binding protein